VTAHREAANRADVVVNAELGAGEPFQDDAEPSGRHVEAAGLEPDAFRVRNPGAVITQVEHEFPGHPGLLSGFAWPVTREQALVCLDDFMVHRLADFGPYEDALVDGDAGLAHSQLSVPLNLGLLTPREVCERILEASGKQPHIPLASTEGFIRQVLGWREFLRHVYRRGMPGLAAADGLGHAADLPSFYWTGETRMRCLGEAVRGVLATGYAHHIQRLMVLGNWALLAGVEARQVNE
jgi:deoxyribodipyrimidine photolyase-related protein